MFVCMHFCVCECMFVCTYVYLSVCVCARVHKQVHACAIVCMWRSEWRLFAPSAFMWLPGFEFRLPDFSDKHFFSC